MNKPSAKTLAWLYAELPALEAAGLVTAQGAAGIRQRYGPVQQRSAAAIAVIGLSALGAAFIIGGVILLLASNWEMLGRTMRAGVALGLLIAAQAVVAFTLLRRKDSTAWREGSGLFLTGAIGACIALIGQTYHLPGNMEDFLWGWMLLAWPLIYLLNASTLAVLGMGGALSWAAENGSGHSVYLWLFVGGLLPHVALAALAQPGGARFQFLSWFFVPFLLAAPPAFDVDVPPLAFLLGYSLLFALFLFIGLTPMAGGWFNPWRIVGGGGIMALAVMLTFSPAWAGIASEYFYGAERGPLHWRIYLAYFIMLGMFAPLVIYHLRHGNRVTILWALFPLLVLLCTVLLRKASTQDLPVVLCNAYVLVLAIASLREGVRLGRLGLTNIGMALLAIFAIARFVDLQIPFVLRGLLFILIGAAFLAGNIILARRIRDTQRVIA